MVTRVMVGALMLAVALAGWQTLRLRGWQARAVAAEAEVAGWREAARIHRDVAERLAREARAARDLEDDIVRREGADAPVSDYLRGVGRDLDRLRGAGARPDSR